MELVNNLYSKYLNFLDKYTKDILLLALRIFIALVFFRSGIAKIANLEITLLLFEYEYAVPIISPVLAAYSATFFELTCGALLMAGLLTRLAALPLLIMTLVIQFAVFDNPEHFYFLALLATVAVYGGGKISADYILCRICRNSKK